MGVLVHSLNVTSDKQLPIPPYGSIHTKMKFPHLEFSARGTPRITTELSSGQIAGVPWISWEFQPPITFSINSLLALRLRTITTDSA